MHRRIVPQTVDMVEVLQVAGLLKIDVDPVKLNSLLVAKVKILIEDPKTYFAGRIIGDESFSAALASSRKPSQDTTRKPDEREFGPRHSGAVSTSSETTSNLPGTQSTTATSAVIIPNKSTMEEEYIDIPYGRDGRES